MNIEGNILTSRCGVISDIMNTKTPFYVIICDVLSISDVKMNLFLIFWNVQNGRFFGVRVRFEPEVVPEV